nr:zinc finger protein 2-like isoform X2 [Geotrypetes seraphini]XP_033787922.1 zinc finger protein 2-like isoform X2 [Geotrypetes seraphini]
MRDCDENYEALISLGCTAPTPEVLSRIEVENEVQSHSDQFVSEARENATDPSTDFPVITSVFSIQNKENGLQSCRDPSESRGHSPGPSIDLPVITSVFSIHGKEDDPSVSEGREKSGPSPDFPVITSVFSIYSTEQDEVHLGDPSVSETRECSSSLGIDLPVITSVFSFHNQEGGELCCSDRGVSEVREKNASPGTDLPAIASALSFLNPDDGVPQRIDQFVSEAQENSLNPDVDLPVITSVFSFPGKEGGEPQNCNDQFISEMEENDPNLSIDLPVITSVFSFSHKSKELCVVGHPDWESRESPVPDYEPKSRPMNLDEGAEEESSHEMLPNEETFSNGLDAGEEGRCKSESHNERTSAEENFTYINEANASKPQANQKLSMCAEQGKTFSKKDSAALPHPKCPEEITSACTESSKTFGKKLQLVMHEQKKIQLVKHHQMHDKKRPFTCTECLRNFVWFSSLKRHHESFHFQGLSEEESVLLTKHNKRPMVPERVEKQEEISCLTVESHSEKNHFLCTECNKNFNDILSLRRHQEIHKEGLSDPYIDSFLLWYQQNKARWMY